MGVLYFGQQPRHQGECTLQDRCLLAMKPPFPRNLMAHHDDDPRFFAALEQGRRVMAAMARKFSCIDSMVLEKVDSNEKEHIQTSTVETKTKCRYNYISHNK